MDFYSKYQLKDSWPKWFNVQKLNQALQQKLINNGQINDVLFAIHIVTNEQLLKWYQVYIKQKANSRVASQIEGLLKVSDKMNLTEEDKEELTNSYYHKSYFKLILIRALGIDFLLYNDGFGLRNSSSTLQGIRGFMFYISIYYLIPIILYWNTGNHLFDLIAITFLTINIIRSYLWLKEWHLKTMIADIFDREKTSLLND